jgi:class 3 adenylate cyclase
MVVNAYLHAKHGSNIFSLLIAAVVIEMLVMAAAVADRFKQTRLQAAQERAQAQATLVEGLRQSALDLESKVTQRTQELAQSEAKAKELLHNMLPAEVAEELSSTGQTKPARFESASVLFTDFSGFTQVASTMPAGQMVSELNDIFAAFDDICDAEGVEKIKTIGDAYMAAAGVPQECADHAQRCVRAGQKMLDFVQQRNARSAFKWGLRVGIHSGHVVAGVVGKRKFAFDIWGDTVNIASRMESAGEEGRINVSAYTYHLIQNDFACEYRGKVDAKGKGEVDMYFVV